MASPRFGASSVRRFALFGPGSRAWAILVVVAGCTEPHFQSGRLRCATAGRACPDGFYCASDGACWQNGSGPDFGITPPDLAATADLAGLDLSGLDLATPTPDLASTPSLCAGLAVLVCDGFEDATINTARWQISTNAGSATPDKSFAFRGSGSVHLHTDQITAALDDPRAELITYQGLPFTGTVYMRGWFYFKAPMPDGFDQVLNFADQSGTGIALGVQAAAVVDNDYTHGQWGVSAIAKVPTNMWTCLRLAIPTGTGGMTQLWADGTEATDVEFPIPSPQPLVSHVYIGLSFTGTVSSQMAFDAWLDEVIVDNKPIGCPE